MIKENHIKGWFRIFAVAAALLAFVIAAPVSAQLPGADEEQDTVTAQDLGLYYGNRTGLGQRSLQDTIARIIRIALSLLGIIAIVIILAGGVRWMTAGGDSDKVDKAKLIIRNGVIGLAIILSSYAITQFVINTLLDANNGGAGAGQVGDGDEGGFGFGGRCNNPPCGGNNFVAKISPKGQQRIQNVVVKINFQERGRAASVNQESVVWPESVKVFKTGQVDELAPMELSFESPSELHLSPTGACPEPHQDRLECLEADTSYTVQITTAIEEAGTERSLHCPLGDSGAFSCTKVFITGNEFDAEPPTVSLLSHRHGGSIELGEDETLRARARDNMGVDVVQFLINDEVVYAADPEDSPSKITESYVWEVDPEIYQPLEPVLVQINARDVDGNSAQTEPISLIPRPAHCFNDVQDEDEEGEDCGGAWCGACGGGACERDADCAGGFCQIAEGEEVGQCVDRPVITGINPEDGAPGTMVTITGEHFGDNAGSVVFYIDPENPNAAVAADAGACGVQWSAERITVMVPEELQAGNNYPLGVLTGDLSDRSDDDFGADFDDVFEVNETIKPGLCSIDPQDAVVNDLVTVRGVNLGDGDASGLLFGGQRSRVQNWQEDQDGQLGSITAFVPNIEAGRTGVQAQVGEERSNALNFRVRAFSDQDRPTLAGVSPANGPPGTYITLTGNGFGRGDQGSVVIFEDKIAGDTIQADTEFPAVCGDGTWNDSTIVVKVPEGVREDEHSVYVRLGGSLIESLPMDFGVSGGDPPPGVCKVDPNMRGVGGWIDVYGEHFGDDGTVRFWTAGSLGDPITWAPADNNVVGSVWGGDNGDTIKVTVPEDAITGPMLVLRDDAGISNQTPFTVGSCLQNNNICPVEGQSCCATGFHAGSCQNSCEEVARESEYSWIFSTGIIPTIPSIVECCGRNCPAYNELPSPSPWVSHRDSETVCSNAMIRGTITTEIDLERDDPTQKIVLDRCIGDEENPCEELEEVHRGAQIINNAGFSEFQFAGEHEPALEASTMYQVRIEAGMFARSNDNEGIVGGIMPENDDYSDACGNGTAYCFRFSTNADQCVLAAVTVVPSNFTAREIGFLVQDDENHVIGQLEPDSKPLYHSTGVSDNSCVALDPDDYDWEWRSNSFRARVSGDGPEGDHTQHVRAQVTTLADPVVISAIASGIQGSGNLHIIPDKPRIITAWPQCETMCVNGEIGVSFNVAMQQNHFSPFTMGIFECENELCEMPDDITNFGVWAELNKVRFAVYADQEGAGFSSWQKHMARLTLSENLQPDTFYRVMMRGLIASAEGANLFMTEDEYDFSVGEGIINQYKSFTFRTDQAGGNCALEEVGITPVDRSVSALGVKQLFVGTAMGQNNGCGPDGGRQRLNADDMSWNWSASHEMVEIEVFDVADEPAPGCTAQCLMIGSEPVQYVCGNGVVDPGEDCDDPNAQGCSDRCLFEGAVPECLPDDEGVIADIVECPIERIVGADPCGNGELDAGEQCDDGNKVSNDGCSTLCMNEGSSVVGVQCGNRDIVPGEGCDDGNTQSGDGCSSECLNEGSPLSRQWCGQENNAERHALCASAISVCGNNFLEIGEECDDGNLLNTDACTDQCLQSGGVGDSCGNGQLDVDLGEQCDGTEGCGDDCRWLGSSLSYENPSICGDGLGVGGSAGTGENPRCEAGVVGDGESDPVILAQMTHVPDDRLEDLVAQAAAGEQRPRIENIIEATARYGNGEPQSANATFALECGYTEETNPRPDEYGVGLGGCLYPYPVLERPRPTGEGACRNPVLTIDSATGFDSNSLDGNIFLAVKKEACADGEILYGDRADAGQEDVALWRRVIGLALRGLRTIFGSPVSAQEGGVFAPPPEDQGDLGDAPAEDAGPPPPEVEPANLVWCASPIKARYEVVDENETQQLRIMPLAALAAEAEYRVILVGNTAVLNRDRAESVRDGFGTALNGNFDQWEFSTGTDICTLDEVAVEPSNWMFGTTARETGQLCSEETAEQVCGESGLCVDIDEDGIAHCDLSRHHFVTTALTGRDAAARPISPIADVYDWKFKWGPLAESIIDLETGINEDENASDDRRIRVASKQGESGIEQLSSVATITADNINQVSQAGAVVTGIASINVTACDNPWPPLTGDGPIFPYEDVRRNLSEHQLPAEPGILPDPGDAQEAGGEGFAPPPPAGRVVITNDDLIEDKPYFTNFSTWYCRDSGDVGTDDDLPALDPLVAYQNANVDPEMIKRIHFRNHENNDLIGIMVRSNPQWLTLSQWYADAFPGQGTLAPLQDIDGFEAARLGNTLYVNAINYLPDSADMFSNIYIFSVSGPNSLLPSQESQDIFQQLVDNLTFVANIEQYNRCSLRDNITPDPQGIKCTNDYQCAENRKCLSDRDKLKRDLIRVEHIKEVSAALRSAKVGTGNFPLLNEAGGSGSFIPNMSVSGWPSWQASLGNALGTAFPEDPSNKLMSCVGEGVDPQTCWNPDTQQFTCSTRSQIYEYRGNAEGSSAQLGLQFEFFDTDRDTQIAQTLVDQELEGLSISTAICGGQDGQVLAAGVGTCGNGIVESNESCEQGDTNTDFAGTIGYALLAPGRHTLYFMKEFSMCNNVCTAYEPQNPAVRRCSEDTTHECRDDDDCVRVDGQGLGTCERLVPENGSYFQSEIDAHVNTIIGAAQCGNNVLDRGEFCEEDGVQLVSCSTNRWVREAPDAGESLSEGLLLTQRTYSIMECINSCSESAQTREIIQKRCSNNRRQACTIDAHCPGGSCEVRNNRCSTLEEIAGAFPDINNSRGLFACGDGRVADNEACDSGWQFNGKYGGYCDSRCEGYTPYCGDRRKTPEELCDVSARVGSPWALAKEDSCSESCLTYGSYCGDGTKDAPHEECDDGNNEENDGCDATCHDEPPGEVEAAGDDLGEICGNGRIDDGEQCDQGDQNGIACEAEYDDQCAYCSATCTNVLYATGPFCGDRHIDEGIEVCEANRLNFSCLDMESFESNDEARQCSNSCDVEYCNEAGGNFHQDNKFVICREGDNCVPLKLTLNNTFVVNNTPDNDMYEVYLTALDGPVRGTRAKVLTKPTGRSSVTVTIPAVPKARYVLELIYKDSVLRGGDRIYRRTAGTGDFTLTFARESGAARIREQDISIIEKARAPGLRWEWRRIVNYLLGQRDDPQNNGYFGKWVEDTYAGITDEDFGPWLNTCMDAAACTRFDPSRWDKRRLRTAAGYWDDNDIFVSIGGIESNGKNIFGKLPVSEDHAVTGYYEPRPEIGVTDGGAYFKAEINVTDSVWP